MHRSRIYALIVDVPDDKTEDAVKFWSAALGTPTRSDPEEPQFISLLGAIPDLTTAIQSIDDSPRYHIDIETDDVDAEVERLTALGASPVSQWLQCHVLRAPGGHLLCVIPVHSDAEFFAGQARIWT